MIGVCRFCGCTQNAPCIFTNETAALLGSACCAWWFEDVCTAPPCVEKLYKEVSAGVLADFLEAAA